MEEHSTHVKQNFDFAQNNDYILNIFKHFYDKIKNVNDDQLRNFKEKVNSTGKIVETFFTDELVRVEQATSQLVILLQGLNIKIRKLISMYEKKFIEEFDSIKDEYDKFIEEMKACTYNYLITKLFSKI